MTINHIDSVPLPGNRSSAFPSRCLYLDTETHPVPWKGYEKHLFVIAWSAYCFSGDKTHRPTEDWKLWDDPGELCTYIQGLVHGRQSLTIYTHNAFFDLQASRFYYYFSRWGWKYDFLYDEGLTYIFCIRKGSSSIKVISTTNYFDFSLKKLGEDVGLQKLETDPLNSSRDELIRYCRRDVEILVRSMAKYKDFNREHDTGRFSMTKASQSFNCYRHRFMDQPIYLHSLDPAVSLERDSYFGGRTEAFHIGECSGGPFTFLDINSMYPFVMKEYAYPSKLIFYTDTPTLETIAKYLHRTCMIADVSLSTDVPAYALRRDDKLIFPIGRFRTCLCTKGIEQALKNDHIRKVHRLAVYESEYLFGRYVDYFYPLKQTYGKCGNVLYRTIVKLFLNSLYGKFGQKQPITEMIDAPQYLDFHRRECFSLATGERWIETTGFGKMIHTEGEKNGSKSFVAIASHVTEYSRFALWNLLVAAGDQRVLYVDTDSLVLRSEDTHSLDRFIHPQRLGALAIDKVCQRLVVKGLKDYQADDIIKIKGVPKTANRIAENTYQYTQFLGQSTHMRMDDIDGVLTQSMIKELRREYDKGTVDSEGRVHPFYFEDF